MTIAGYRKKHAEDAPTAPSSVVKDMDPAVERVILRCIEKDPALRPASATQVAAALPGGDPLAAALAAGETPSPEMVAAAGVGEGLSPRVAWSIAGVGLALLVAVAFLAPGTRLLERMGYRKSPEVMSARAREILARLGYPAEPADSALRFQQGPSHSALDRRQRPVAAPFRPARHGRDAVLVQGIAPSRSLRSPTTCSRSRRCGSRAWILPSRSWEWQSSTWIPRDTSNS